MKWVIIIAVTIVAPVSGDFSSRQQLIICKTSYRVMCHEAVRKTKGCGKASAAHPARKSVSVLSIIV